MSHRDVWCSKDDILKDLHQVTGICDSLDDYIVRGGRPPPPRRIEEDEEMNCRLGESEPLSNSFNQGPDLVGIQHMLQMVNNYDEVQEDKSEPLEPAQTTIEISKLNPNVAEFIPKTPSTSSPKKKSERVIKEVSGNNIIDDTNVNSDLNKCNKKKDCYVVTIKENVNMTNSHNIDPISKIRAGEKCKESEKSHDINITKRIDVSKLKPDEITDMTKKLKSKIISASEKDPQSKRERNVAIATLLKLHSSKSKVSTSPVHNNDENPILYTPAYFEKSIPKAPSKEVSSIHEKNEKVPPRSDIQEQSFETVNKNVRLNAPSPKAVSSTSSDTVTRIPENQDVLQSIEKVNKWLEKPTTPERSVPKQKGIYLGPISFKKKDKPKSPLSDDSKRVTPVKGIAPANVTHYKPSKYAEDLSKKYTERSNNKAHEITTTDNNIWARVEMQMKAKEQRMKNQKLVKSPTSASGRGNSRQDDNIDSAETGS